MVDEAFLGKWSARLREMEPAAVAVLVTGSYARHEAGPQSDLDLLVLTSTEPAAPYRALFEELSDGRLLHVSIGAKQWDDWLSRRNVPAGWSFFLPAREVARVLWVADELLVLLSDPVMPRPPG